LNLALLTDSQLGNLPTSTIDRCYRVGSVARFELIRNELPANINHFLIAFFGRRPLIGAVTARLYRLAATSGTSTDDRFANSVDVDTGSSASQRLISVESVVDRAIWNAYSVTEESAGSDWVILR
jgi:hypothetical protein